MRMLLSELWHYGFVEMSAFDYDKMRLCSQKYGQKAAESKQSCEVSCAQSVWVKICFVVEGYRHHAVSQLE